MNVKTLVAGNWKMNKTLDESISFIEALSHIPAPQCEVLLAVPFIYLKPLQDIAPKWLTIAAQNISDKEQGAYTGEISAKMLELISIKSTLIGHSERRQYYGETNAVIKEKLQQAFQNAVMPILCIGETLDERKNNLTEHVIENQLASVLTKADANKSLHIAYEPVWAIGTGETATKEQAEAMHHFIYNWLKENVSETFAQQTKILYGGSCNTQNAEELFSMPHIHGGLIGGASLDVDSFKLLIEIGNTITNKNN
jgi:triosephosphate isomerase